MGDKEYRGLWAAAGHATTVVGVVGSLWLGCATLLEIKEDRRQRFEEQRIQEAIDERLQERLVREERLPVVRFVHEYLSVGSGEDRHPTFHSVDSLPLKNYGRGPAFGVTVVFTPSDGRMESGNGPLTEELARASRCVTIPDKIDPGKEASLFMFPNVSLDGKKEQAVFVAGAGRIEYRDERGEILSHPFRFSVQKMGEENLSYGIFSPRTRPNYDEVFR